MAPKRAAASDTAATSKKFRSAIDEVADEYVCPITAELPLDPVTAEDGHVYERKAIEKFFASRAKAGTAVTSPMTNLPMGHKLLPNKQARNAIEKLVRSGAISAEKAQLWQKRLKDEERVKEKRAKAESGDIHAISELARWYSEGSHGLAKDDAAYFHWFDVGAQADSLYCLRKKANHLINGIGVQKQQAQGLGLFFQAAGSGSQIAAFHLGEWYDAGKNGLPKSRKEAKYWYRKVATASEDKYKAEIVEKKMQQAAARALEPLDLTLA